MLLHCFTIGTTHIEIHDGWTITRFADGREVCARHDDVAHLGQADTAAALGYVNVPQMNRDHDLCHSLLAYWHGWPYSPVLYALAHELPVPANAWHEEAQVLALQRLLVALRLDVLAMARALSASSDGQG